MKSQFSEEYASPALHAAPTTNLKAKMWYRLDNSFSYIVTSGYGESSCVIIAHVYLISSISNLISNRLSMFQRKLYFLCVKLSFSNSEFYYILSFPWGICLPMLFVLVQKSITCSVLIEISQRAQLLISLTLLIWSFEYLIMLVQEWNIIWWGFIEKQQPSSMFI